MATPLTADSIAASVAHVGGTVTNLQTLICAVERFATSLCATPGLDGIEDVRDLLLDAFAACDKVTQRDYAEVAAENAAFWREMARREVAKGVA